MTGRSKEIPIPSVLSSFAPFPSTPTNLNVHLHSSTTLNLSSPRLHTVNSALVSSKQVVDFNNDMFTLTYLEGNSWLWEVGGLKILVDPILVGNLDFGIPWLYDAPKKFLKNFKVIYLEPGQDSVIEVSNDFQVKIKATAGPVLGPPLQRPENGFLVPMKNGDLDSKGLLASIVHAEGTMESFKILCLHLHHMPFKSVLAALSFSHC